MIYNKKLVGDKIYLRQLELSDCNEAYLGWLEDVEVNQYLESRWQVHNIDSIKEFVKSIQESTHSYFFAIVYDNKHIGNIKIGPIHSIYKEAYIGYFIGDKSVWGKGIATESIALITDFGFDKLGLNKIMAGAFEDNVGSQKALLKNGLKQEARFRKNVFVNKDNDYQDTLVFGILKNEWKK